MELGYVFLSFGMGCIAYFLAYTVHKEFQKRQQKDLEHWEYELEHSLKMLIDAHLNVAHWHRVIDSKISEIPENFEAPLFVAAKLGYAVERAVLREAEKRNLYNPKLHLPNDKLDIPVDLEGIKDIEIPRTPIMELKEHWEGGRLIPMRKSK
jgi:hypothetical protein